MANLPPGPKTPALIQMLQWILWPLPFLDGCFRKYGSLFTTRFPGTPPFVTICDPVAVKEVFAGSPDTLHSGVANRILKPTVGERSILLADGHEHLRLRRLMTPPFRGERMRSYRKEMERVSQRVSGAWDLSGSFPLYPEMQSLTLQVIIHVVFGLGEGERFGLLRERLARLLNTTSNPLGLLFIDHQGEIRFKTLLSAPRFLSPYVRMQRLLEEIDGILYAEIEERRRSDFSARTDILSLLIASQDDDGQPLSAKELRDQMLTLLLAGHETTATALCWAFYRILSHDDVRARLERELEDNDWSPDLPYLDAVIKETLRIHPIFTAVVRYLQAPLEIAGRMLPAGVSVAPCIYLAHLRSDVWENPQHFDPDRMLGRRFTPFEFFPFGGGVRRCLGAEFAIYEMKIVIPDVLKHFRMTLKPGYRMRVARRGLALAPSRGLPVLARRK